jgi:hypothetical protein
MRYLPALLSMVLCPLTPAAAQVRISIGIDLPTFPQLVLVPDYPVYYAPGVDSNFFFYDGMYWVYQGDTWFASSWYNGPWAAVDPELVPAYVLRVPVRYYRQPPAYFRGWRADAPPRWGEHWGNDWERRHGGWDQWDRRAAPPPAPLPAYQKEYPRNRYPQADQQRTLQGQRYPYQPRDPTVQRAHLPQAPRAAAPASQGERNGGPPARTAGPRDVQRRGSPAPPRVEPGVPAAREQPPRQQEQARAPQGRGRAPEQARAPQGGGRAPEQSRAHQGGGGAPGPSRTEGHAKPEEQGREHNR